MLQKKVLKILNLAHYLRRYQGDSNSQSLPPESNALPLGHGTWRFKILLFTIIFLHLKLDLRKLVRASRLLHCRSWQNNVFGHEDSL